MIAPPSPTPVSRSTAPRLHGATVLGVRPGAPLVYAIPASGTRPLRFHAERLPAGATLDSITGCLAGAVNEPGTYRVRLGVENDAGRDERELRLVVGERIALTPPLGWNSWNCWGDGVTADNVLRSAHAMKASGLADYGWSYINIDDGWQGRRNGKSGALQPNEKFPDMAELCARIHALGLRVGLYSTPFITSYAGYCGGSSRDPSGAWVRPPRQNGYYPSDYIVGDYMFEAEDARQWADWGVDYLKYDWNVMDPVRAGRMHRALRECGRDIVLSLSNNAPFADAGAFAKVAQGWRTTRNLRDCWSLPSDDASGFLGLPDVWRAHAVWAPFTGPGHWADPDMLVLGKVGWGAGLRPTRLTPVEQRTHVGLWSLWAAPLLIGCPLEELDPFTLGLLTNPEVLEVNQDGLGLQALAVRVDGAGEVLAKRLENGDVAVGLFNAGEEPATVEVTWAELGLPLDRSLRVRDLWVRRDLGVFTHGYGDRLAPHDHRLLRLGAP